MVKAILWAIFLAILGAIFGAVGASIIRAMVPLTGTDKMYFWTIIIVYAIGGAVGGAIIGAIGGAIIGAIGAYKNRDKQT